MKQLHIKLKNCFGIKSFDREFSFVKGGKDQRNSVFIYASNGTMKTSFASTLKRFSEGNDDEIMDRVSKEKGEVELIVDGKDQIDKGRILVVDGDNKDYDSSAMISKFLASPKLKDQYVSIHKELSEGKDKLMTKLKTTSKSKDCESELLETFSDSANIFEILKDYKDRILNPVDEYDFKYNVVFDKDGKVKDFVDKNLDDLEAYQQQYETLMSNSTFYGRNNSKFGTYQAKQIERSTSDNSFFEAGHKIVLGNEMELDSNTSVSDLINNERESILSDPDLRVIFERIDKKLAANNQLREFKNFLEVYPELLTKVLAYEDFQKEVWISFLSKHKDDVNALVELYEEKKAELEEVNRRAKEELSLWKKIIDTYNSRFLVPFTVQLKNVADVILQEETASLDFYYEDKSNPLEKEKLRDILSKGEERAFFILQLLFEIESMKDESNPGLLVFDDIADSFDYKNKYAIVEYLKDLNDEGFFRLIILTHNFDFYRTITQRINHRSDNFNSYFAMKLKGSSSLKFLDLSDQGNGRGILKPFMHWQNNIDKPSNFIASIPFFRNLVEFTSSNYRDDENYLGLTKVLHYREDTVRLTVQDLIDIIQNVKPSLTIDGFSTNQSVLDLIFNTCDDIEKQREHNLLDLANKVTLSIGIRLKGEFFMISELGRQLNNGKKTTGALFSNYKKRFGGNNSDTTKIDLMSQICLMTPENIHLNSFMYEPLLDMDIHHLVDLYKKVTKLYDGVQARINMN